MVGRGSLRRSAPMRASAARSGRTRPGPVNAQNFIGNSSRLTGEWWGVVRAGECPSSLSGTEVPLRSSLSRRRTTRRALVQPRDRVLSPCPHKLIESIRSSLGFELFVCSGVFAVHSFEFPVSPELIPCSRSQGIRVYRCGIAQEFESIRGGDGPNLAKFPVFSRRSGNSVQRRVRDGLRHLGCGSRELAMGTRPDPENATKARGVAGLRLFGSNRKSMLPAPYYEIRRVRL